MYRLKALMGCAILICTACDSDPETDAGAGDAGVTDAGVTDAGVTDAGVTDSGFDASMPPVEDDNDTFSTADPIALGATTTASIGTPGDVDYYTFSGTAGQWLQIDIDANPDGDRDRLDTVVTLYDASMTQIAENDQAVRNLGPDSEIITRLPADGTYYVLVQDYYGWDGRTPRGQADFVYQLFVASIRSSDPGVNVDAEGGDDVGSAQALTYQDDTTDFGLILGDFRDDSDVDVYSFSVADPKNYIRFSPMPSGTEAEGYGSTTTPVRIAIGNAAGDEIIARIDLENSSPTDTEIHPPLPAGDYTLWVESGGVPGTNGFYVLKAYRANTFFGGAPEVEPNDGPGSAQALSFETEGSERFSFFHLQLPDGDEDYFSFEVMGTEVIDIYCDSAYYGSGVQGFTATVLNAAGDMTLGSSTEAVGTRVDIAELDVGPGSYLLRLSKTGQSEVTATWAFCDVYLYAPEP